MFWETLLEPGQGKGELDLVLRRAELVNVLSGEIHTADIGIHQGRFVGLGPFPSGKEEIDLKGKYVVPGLIDAHVHLESSLLCPEEFCSVLLSHGVTAAVLDPHELANVFGGRGIEYALHSTEELPFNAFVALPSCVPATRLETSGASLNAPDLLPFVPHPRVTGLGEVMDYRSVLQGTAEMLAKLKLPVKHRDGHAPGLNDMELNGYALAGIETDHECSTAEEGLERLRRGFYLMIREGSAAKNLHSLLPVINEYNSHQCLWVTDDRHLTDLLDEGSIDHLIRLAIKAGIPPVRAIQMGTINPARAMKLPYLGAVHPGYWADFVILDELESFRINQVYHHGQLLSTKGSLPQFSPTAEKELKESIQLSSFRKEQLAVQSNEENPTVNIIQVQEGSLLTSLAKTSLPVVKGEVQTDPDRDIAKLAVLERHHDSGRVGLGFIQGLGIKNGALASSVAHDSHNLIVTGLNDDDMALAVSTLIAMRGGLCVVRKGKVLASLPLPIAGLMSDQRAANIYHKLNSLHSEARQLGLKAGIDPFMTLAFMALPVIPDVKLTDLGLVDVKQEKIIPLIE